MGEELFARVAAEYSRCCWLDGGGGRDWSGRRSLLGWLTEDDVSLTWSATTGEVVRHAGGRAITIGTDPFAALEAELAAGGPHDRWFGWFGYAARTDLPTRRDAAPAATGPAGGEGADTVADTVPDVVWMRPSRVVEHDLPAAPPATPAAAVARPPSADRVDTTIPAAYARGFETVQRALHAGDSYEVNLTYRRAIAAEPDPVTAYARLRRLNPAPYAGFVQHDVPGHRGWLLSSSPERYATIGADRVIETRPIKGTTPRSTDPVLDEQARHHLATGARFRAENLMITDLLRSDLARVCEVGSVRVPALMMVESYPSVHQLVTTVRGRLRPGVGTVAALRSLFPAGSMTGAPRLRTMSVIAEAETTPRGVYAGAFGWIGADGRADLGVVIRSLTTTGSGTWQLGTGGGITVRSDPAEEYAESCWKAERLLAALTPPDG